MTNVVRRLILKGIGGRGARPQAVLELETPRRISTEDMTRALAAAAESLGVTVRTTGSDLAPTRSTKVTTKKAADHG